MPRINRLVFMLGGVIVPPITQTVLATLALHRKPDAATWPALLDLEKSLTIGAMPPQEYCRQVIQLTGSSVGEDDLFEAIPEHAHPLPGILPLIMQLSPKYSLRLVSDYPRCWMQPILHHTTLSPFFAPETLLVTAEHNLSPEPPALFKLLVDTTMIIPGSSLWVDHNPLRTTAAIRHGIDAAIYVDTNRLIRDLSLWGLVPRPQG